MAQPPVAGPLAEADLRDQLRLRPRDVLLADLVGERRAVAMERLELLREVAQRRAREPGPDLARIAQLARVVVAQQQRAELDPRAGRRREAADHQLLLGRALELQPVARAAVHVRRLG